MTLHEITKITHDTLQATALRLGREIKIENDKIMYVDTEDWTGVRECALGVDSISISSGGLCIREHEFGKTIKIFSDWVIKIETPQIRQILLAFYDVLGSNPAYEKAKSESIPNEENGYDPEYSFACDENFYIRLAKHKPQKHFSLDCDAYGYVSWADLLNDRWSGTLKLMFDTDPVAVLTELNELLKVL